MSHKNGILAVYFYRIASGFFVALFLSCSIFLSSTLAAPDQELTYHGKLTDTLGLAVSDGNYDFTISIYDASTGGTRLWTARGTVGAPAAKSVTVTNGVFTTTLGESGDNVLTIDFDENYYLGVTIGSNSEMTPRRKITPTGFALNAHRLNGLTADNYLDTSSAAQTKSGALSVGGDFTVNADDLFVNTSNGRVGIGTSSPDAQLHAVANSEQLRVGYNSSNYLSTTVSSTGGVTFNAYGTGQSFTFSDSVGVTGSIVVEGNVVPVNDNFHDLGTAGSRWQDLYLGPGSLHIGTTGDEGVISYDTTNDVFNFDKAATFGDTSNDVEGTIRYNGTDFEGYDGTQWISMTAPEISGTNLDDVFSTNGILRRTAAGTYSTITDNSTNWNTAYGWGDHSVEGYLTTVDISSNTNLTVGNGITLTGDTLTVTAAGGLLQTTGGLTTTGILEDINTLGVPTTDGQFIVATGAGAFAYESGATVRTSLGLGSLATLSTITTTNITNSTITAADLNLTDITLNDFTNDAGFITSADDTVSGTELDGVFSTTGILRRTAAGTYSTITDNSTNWNTAYGWGDHSAEGYLTANQSITLTGDITGTGTTSIATTIAANSVALGTDTTGSYVSGNTAGSGITVTGTAGEGWSPTIAVTSNGITDAHLQYDTGQHLTTTSTPTFAGVTLNGNLVLGANTITTTNTALIANLNADLLDGQEGSYYRNASNINAGTLSVARGGTGTSTQFTSGSIVFAGASGIYDQDNANFFWDDSTNRLGIGTNTPSSMLTLFGVNNGLRFAYDVSNYADLGVDSGGELTISASSAAESAVMIGGGFAQDVSVQFDGSAHDFFSGIDNAYGSYTIGAGTDVSSTATITGPGTVTNSAGGTTVTGAGTKFLSTFRVGNTITIGSDTVTITAIASDTSMTTTSITSAHSGATYTYAGGTKLTVEPSGNMGIGIADPLYALDVRTTGSDAIIARFNNASTNTTCTLTSNGGTINCSSDERLKKNIASLNDGLDTLMRLRPTIYNWKYEKNGAPYTMGFIAQEVEDILPQLVITDPDNGYKQLSTIGMIPLITKAIQEQNTLITNKADQNALRDLETLIGDIPSQVRNDIGSVLNTMSGDILMLQKDANAQADLIASIQETVADMEQMNIALKDFYMLIDADRLVYTDADDNLTIDGIIITPMIKTGGIVIAGEEEGARIGVAAIAEDAYDVFVSTTAVTSKSRIFVTPRGDVITQPLAVTRVDDHSGFHVTVADPVDKPLVFDWMIVDDHVKRDETLSTEPVEDVEEVNTDDAEVQKNEVVVEEDQSGENSEDDNIQGVVVEEVDDVRKIDGITNDSTEE